MKLVADADVHERIVARLQEYGHEVIWIAEIGPRIPDDVVRATAAEQAAILLTADKDFGELIVTHRHPTGGVVLLRLGDLPPVQRAAIVSATIKRVGDQLHGAFTVIEPGNIRIRPLDPR